jgi:hypothetical protein
MMWTLLGVLFTLGSAMAEPPVEKRQPAKGNEGEVTCVDGNKARIVLQNDSVNIETKYGKLVIPAADIERIEFAFRFPDCVAKKIAAAVKRLGDVNFKEREAASKELLAIGVRSFPHHLCEALVSAAQDHDPQ